MLRGMAVEEFTNNCAECMHSAFFFSLACTNETLVWTRWVGRAQLIFKYR